MISRNVEETMKAGERLAKKLKKGDFVALIGGLGSGKTVFTKGIARGLGVKNARYVNSPTFVIIKEYRGRLALYHFDLYRLDNSSVIDAGIFEEYFYGDGVSVVEWADRIRDLLPRKRITVKLSVTGENKRKIEITV